jgi:hypothetical protein
MFCCTSQVAAPLLALPLPETSHAPIGGGTPEDPTQEDTTPEDSDYEGTLQVRQAG